jgi:subtilisin family serine protease
MKKYLILILALSMGLPLMAQQKVWVFLADKGNCAEEQLQHPENLLSPAALERRATNNIQVNMSDVPVASEYVDLLKVHSHRVVSSSRWLNAVVVELTPDCLAEVEALDFVTGLRPVQTLVEAHVEEQVDEGPISPQYPRYVDADAAFDYGEAAFQNNMLNIVPLHNRGITGKGVRIAIFDSGFSGADTIDVFDSTKVIYHWDFVENHDAVFNDHSHGTQVASTIGANLPGEMVGMAPHASFMFCRTEDARRETRQEEHNWVRALEVVDSIGVDIIHTSLGYSEFDNDEESYTYDDLDGNTTIITLAADRAAAKGIIVTTSAGNEGSGSWRYITAPCDADSVLCIGSITKAQTLSRFSSVGPAADGRVKPDVVAMGSRTTVASPRNYISKADGTSFSGPLIGGLVTCLKQAHPDRSNMDIIKAVQLSADQYPFPDNDMGYGIPNAVIADSLLANVEDLSTVTRDDIAEKPNRGRIKSRPAKTKTTPAKPAIVFAADPKSTVSLNGSTLTISSDDRLRTVQIMRGTQKVTLNPKHVEISDNTATLDLSYLLDGEHYVYIKTRNYEENVKINR